MAALHRAIALVEVQDVAVAVAEDLHFDVAGAAHEALQEDGVVAERGAGFAARFFQRARRNPRASRRRACRVRRRRTRP